MQRAAFLPGTVVECGCRAPAHGAHEPAPLTGRDWGDRVAYSLDPDGHVPAFADAENGSAGVPW